VAEHLLALVKITSRDRSRPSCSGGFKEGRRCHGVGLIDRARPPKLLAEVVMARQPEVFVRALDLAEAQRLVKIATLLGATARDEGGHTPISGEDPCNGRVACPT
jgi:hypothetical protein